MGILQQDNWYTRLVECPQCGRDMDLTDYVEFWYVNDVEVEDLAERCLAVCSKCSYVFIAKRGDKSGVDV